MPEVYKIHPAIGIARVGDSPDAFFVGPETPGAPGVDIAADGTETPVTHYKAAGAIKRQAARFRVFEYKVEAAGQLTLVREVTADDATIEWTVNLVNRKGALDHGVGDGHPAGPRNQHLSGAARDKLVIRDPRERTVAGKNQTGVLIDQGAFLDKPVFLGELKTDAKGRLLVLGGRGKSESIPADKPLDSFINNDFWHDDTGDGPVTATLTFAGRPPVAAAPAWVSVGPPDYAPAVGGLVTLYDVAFQAAVDAGFRTAATKPSFAQHILPVLQRASSLRWSHKFSLWNGLSRDYPALAKADAASQPLRKQAAMKVLTPPFISAFVPPFLRTYFQEYVSGNFASDLADPLPAVTVPDALDRAALDACIGLNFFPGIEASVTLRRKELYSEPFRLNPTNMGVFPGCLTEIMAVPWQADFFDCQGNWWPSQRPDVAMLDANNVPGSQKPWADPVGKVHPENAHKEMVANAHRLGFLVPVTVRNETVVVEQERDPTFPRT